MGLVIKDKALEAAVTELASLTGEAWEAALLKAAERELERERERREDIAAVLGLAKEYAATPDRNLGSAEEACGYDERGLPT